MIQAIHGVINPKISNIYAVIVIGLLLPIFK
jgi:hypothetical protein